MKKFTRIRQRLPLFIIGLLSAVLAVGCDTGPDTMPVDIMQPKTLLLGSQKISYYESAGSGTPIMLIHGNSSSGRVFQPQLEGEPGKKHRIVAIDLPGHGHSDPAGDISSYNLSNYAATVVAAAGALHMEDAVFVGWSLGGHILLQAQPSLPRARGFMIFGTPPLASPPAMDKAFLPNPAMSAAFKAVLSEEEAKAFATAFLAPDSSIDIAPFVAAILATDGNARAGLAASIAASTGASGEQGQNHQDEVDIVRHMKQPLAILHGQEDQLVNREYIVALHIPTLWRGAVQVIPGAGHTPQQEQPLAFNTLLEAFVAEVDRPEGHGTEE